MLDSLMNLLGTQTIADFLKAISTIIGIIVALYLFVTWLRKRLIVAIPDFVLRDLHVDDEIFALPTEKLKVPERLEALDGTMLLFTLDSFSTIPMRIQNVYLCVLEVNPLKEATFPYYGEGAPGPEPLYGYVEVKPEPGRYKIKTTNKSKQGKDLDPDEYRIKVYSESGYRYKITIEVEWTDTRWRGKAKEYGFDEFIYLEFPDLTDWQNLVDGANSTKILSYHMVFSLLEDLKRLNSPPNLYKILAASEEQHPDSPVRWLSKPEQLRLAEVVGKLKVFDRPRNFIIIDGRVLILQKEQNLRRGEIIYDQGYIQKVTSVFDSIEEQVKVLS